MIILQNAFYSFNRFVFTSQQKIIFHHQSSASVRQDDNVVLHRTVLGGNIQQLANYLDIQNLTEGYLVLFDHKEIKKWNYDTTLFNGKRIFLIWV